MARLGELDSAVDGLRLCAALLAAMAALCDGMTADELRKGDGDAGDSGRRNGDALCGDEKEKGFNGAEVACACG